MAGKFVIQNDQQLEQTKTFLKSFEECVSKLRQSPFSNIHPRLRQAEIEGMESKIKDFKEEIKAYEKKNDNRVGFIRDVDDCDGMEQKEM